MHKTKENWTQFQFSSSPDLFFSYFLFDWNWQMTSWWKLFAATKQELTCLPVLFLSKPSRKTIRPCQTPPSKPYADNSQSRAPRSTGTKSSATKSERRCRMLRGQRTVRVKTVWVKLMLAHNLWCCLKYCMSNGHFCWAPRGDPFFLKWHWVEWVLLIWKLFSNK